MHGVVTLEENLCRGCSRCRVVEFEVVGPGNVAPFVGLEKVVKHKIIISLHLKKLINKKLTIKCVLMKYILKVSSFSLTINVCFVVRKF